MSLLLYVVTATLLLAAVHRWVTPLSRVSAPVLFLLPLLFTGRALFAGGVYAPVDLLYQFPPFNGLAAIEPTNTYLSDLYAQIMPWRKAVQWSYARGLWPIWNPFILSGDILAAAAQPAAYSPFTLIALLLPVPQGMTFTAAITFLVAAIGAFALARDLGCREVTAFIAAAGWMYATSIAFFVLWPIGFSWALLPLVLFATKRPVLLAVVFVLLILGGHPETVLHVVAIAAVYFLVRRPSLALLWRAVAAGVIALLICAIYLLPIIEAAPQTAEHEFRRLFPQRGVSIENSAARLVTNVFPFLHMARWNDAPHVPIDTAAVGSLILAAALFGVWRARAWFFGGLLLFSLIAQAQPPWFEAAIQYVPFFDLALNSRFSFAAALALVMLAALGLEKAAAEQRSLALAFSAVLIFLIAATWWLQQSRLYTLRPFEWTEHKIIAEIGLLAAATLIFFLGIPYDRKLVAFLGLLLVQRFAEEGRAYPTLPAKTAYPDVHLFSWIKRDQPFRIVGLGRAFPPGTSAFYELEDVRGYEAMTFAPYADLYPIWCVDQPVWFNRVDDLTRPMLSFLNVRYAITAENDPIPPGWREVQSDRGARLLENENFTPRVFVPRYVRLGTQPVIEEMRAATDFREHSWIRAPFPPHERANGPGYVAIHRQGTDYELDVDMIGSGWIVASIPSWKGWRAYIDGRRVETQRANHAFIGLFVPQGKHRVRLTYLPRSFVAGRAITIATLAAIVIAALLRQFRKALLERRDRPLVPLSGRE